MGKEPYTTHFCSPLLVTSWEAWRLGVLMEDRIAREDSLSDFCSSVLVPSKETLGLGLLMDDRIGNDNLL